MRKLDNLNRIAWLALKCPIMSLTVLDYTLFRKLFSTFSKPNRKKQNLMVKMPDINLRGKIGKCSRVMKSLEINPLNTWVSLRNQAQKINSSKQ